MKRCFSVVPYGSVPPAAPPEASKKQKAAVRLSEKHKHNGKNCDPPGVSALRRESCRLANATIVDINDGKFKNDDEFKVAYMELAGRLALDAGQIKRFKGFVVWHHLVPVSEGGDDSPENLRPFIHSSHVLIHIILAT